MIIKPTILRLWKSLIGWLTFSSASLTLSQPPPPHPPPHTHRHGGTYSPTEDHNEVHDIPSVPEIGAFVEHEAQSNDLYTSLKAKHANEVGLCLLLQSKKQSEGQSGFLFKKEKASPEV